MRRLMVLGVLVASTAMAEGIATPSDDMTLRCTGTASKEQDSSGLSFLTGNSDKQRIDVIETANFRLRADGSGEATLPKRMMPAYKQGGRDGWFPTVEVLRADNEITGRVRFHSMYKPRFRIDRITGVATVSGNLGEFSGRCEAYDPATVERKF